MAITKESAEVQSIQVAGSVITATVNYVLSNDATDPATIEAEVNSVSIVVSNATSAELTAVQSIISKAAVIAVA
jgi:ribosomal protein S8E